ncbi:hypothetical protein PYK79_35345, partial [Streptomyces sp. ID05-04B]|nr:hypothetical protein [Streptomyces sp. ID05-04B]
MRNACRPVTADSAAGRTARKGTVRPAGPDDQRGSRARPADAVGSGRTAGRKGQVYHGELGSTVPM